MRAARADANQPTIVSALRSVGAFVQTLHRVGDGCPDLLVMYGGTNYLMEIKDPTKPKGDQMLTRDQVRWHSNCKGRVVVVKTVEDALVEIGVRRRYGPEDAA